MKRWAFLIVLLTCIHCLCRAENPDSLILFSDNAPAGSCTGECSLESTCQSVTAPEDSITDTIKVSAIQQPHLPQKALPNDTIKKRKKLIAALLAFPVPFGIIGLHRIYLGSKPYIPLIYIGTLGGCIGIIPFIDFIVICLEKDITKYCNNPNLIMWAK
jgi:TM2 domain-containing membrane protein YozV